MNKTLRILSLFFMPSPLYPIVKNDRENLWNYHHCVAVGCTACNIHKTFDWQDNQSCSYKDRRAHHIYWPSMSLAPGSIWCERCLGSLLWWHVGWPQMQASTISISDFNLDKHQHLSATVQRWSPSGPIIFFLNLFGGIFFRSPLFFLAFFVLAFLGFNSLVYSFSLFVCSFFLLVFSSFLVFFFLFNV